MFYIYLILNIISKLSYIEAQYPINNYFNLIINSSDSSFLYIGNQLILLEFNESTNLVNDAEKNASYDNSERKFIFYDKVNNNNNTICLCKDNVTECKLKKICIKNIYQSYGESLLIKSDYISYFILFLGFFTTIYGANHYILGLMAHIILFLYYCIKDIVEIFKFFNQYIPYYIFVSSIITGFIFLIFYSNSDSDENSKNKLLKKLYAPIFVFFLFKNIFYYIIIFFPINYIAYIILLFAFLLLGIVGGIIFTYFQISDRYFYIICSIIPGSFYIIKGISYIVGGYYSDIIIIRYKLNFSKGINFGSDGNYKEKMALYICLQFFIILSSTFYQIYITKYILNEKSQPILSSKNSSSRQSLLNNDISDRSTKAIDSSLEFQNNNITLNNNTIINNSGTEGDESNDINDQED